MNKMIPITEAMPEPEVLVSVYSKQGDVYGYARWSNKKKFGSVIGRWTCNDSQSIGFSPISHWWPVPELPEDE